MPVPRKTSLLLLCLALVGAFACFSDEDEPVDYLHIPGAVIIQMKETGLPAKISDPFILPHLTLYGDGTLIFSQEDDRGPWSIQEGRLPERAIRDLLGWFVDQGFLDFAYDYPSPPSAHRDDFTTFIYVHTKLAANAVAVQGLRTARTESLEDEFETYRRIQGIWRTLFTLDPLSLGGSIEGPYIPDSVIITAEPIQWSGRLDPPSVWPFPQIPLSEIASLAASKGSTLITDDAAKDLVGSVLNAVFRDKGVDYVVSYRPILPFEERFPEFDFPAQP